MQFNKSPLTQALIRKNRTRWPSIIAALAIISTMLSLSSTAFAAEGDAKPLLLTKAASPTTIKAGDTVQFSINYTCSNTTPNSTDNCNGTTFADAVPKFTNIYGESHPLEFMSGVGPSATWTTGFNLDNTDPQNPVVRATATNWNAGTSGSIFLTFRAPKAIVPTTVQNIDNTATVNDTAASFTDSSTTATIALSANAPDWNITKTGPGANTRLNRDSEWSMEICSPDPHSALFVDFQITDALPAGFRYISSDLGGVFNDDGQTIGVSDGAATLTWTFGPSNRPVLNDTGCFEVIVHGDFPSGYVDPTSADHANDDNIEDAVKTNSATAQGRNQGSDPWTNLGTSNSSTTLEVIRGAGNLHLEKETQDVNFSRNYYTTSTDILRFGMWGNVDSDEQLDQLTITDGNWTYNDPSNGPGVDNSDTGLPSSFTATSIETGVWNSANTLTIEGSNDNFATSTNLVTGRTDPHPNSRTPNIPVSSTGERMSTWQIKQREQSATLMNSARML